ncbi:hypothetical protein AXG93_93s1030 [Marchantia polymorpha subsp. ruderalis]|uniref:Uncharacterized protein n=1 Tax=Marchantia polymorpha subsp. ruderalis TaxID=1480154 RepID=A0A176WTX6_MARPO|nr:hypothetical protein AXG93_93s1030 [Marchantia polymorpha subsp. ruderalis]
MADERSSVLGVPCVASQDVDISIPVYNSSVLIGRSIDIVVNLQVRSGRSSADGSSGRRSALAVDSRENVVRRSRRRRGARGGAGAGLDEQAVAVGRVEDAGARLPGHDLGVGLGHELEPGGGDSEPDAVPARGREGEEDADDERDEDGRGLDDGAREVGVVAGGDWCGEQRERAEGDHVQNAIDDVGDVHLVHRVVGSGEVGVVAAQVARNVGSGKLRIVEPFRRDDAVVHLAALGRHAVDEVEHEDEPDECAQQHARHDLLGHPAHSVVGEQRRQRRECQKRPRRQQVGQIRGHVARAGVRRCLRRHAALLCSALLFRSSAPSVFDRGSERTSCCPLPAIYTPLALDRLVAHAGSSGLMIGQVGQFLHVYGSAPGCLAFGSSAPSAGGGGRQSGSISKTIHLLPNSRSSEFIVLNIFED